MMKWILIIVLFQGLYAQYFNFDTLEWKYYLDSLQKEKGEEEALKEAFILMLKDSNQYSLVHIAEQIQQLKRKHHPTLTSTINMDSVIYTSNQKLNTENFKNIESQSIEFEWNKKEYSRDSNYRIYGFHPYWLNQSYKSYNFSLLSDINFFSCKVNPKTGSLNQLEMKGAQKLLDSCDYYGVKKHLNISCFGARNLKQLLHSHKAIQKCISEIMVQVKLKGFDGVCIDFEGLRKGSEQAFFNFIVLLRNELKQSSQALELHLCIPAVDYHQLFDLNQFNQFVDLFIIMGYQFHGSFSKNAGPIAPLESGNKWWGQNLTTSLNNYLKFGINTSKIILALPYYGSDWTTESWYIPSVSKQFQKHLTYTQVLNLCKDAKNAILEDFSGSKCYFYKDKQQNAHQVWFEDSASLAIKYQWIKQKQLGGVGIWALGFDHGRSELWNLLASEFTVKDQSKKNELNWSGRLWHKVNYGFRVLRNPKLLLRRPRTLLWGFGAVTGISLFSFYLIYRQAHRLKKWMFKGLQMSLMLGLIILIFGGMFLLMNSSQLGDNYTKYVLLLILGFALGALAMVLFNRHQFFSKDKP